MSNKGNRYIYVLYVYNCNVILTDPMKNRNDKEMIREFIDLVTDLKTCGFNPQ